MITWDGWWSNWDGGLRGLGWAGNVGECWRLLDGLASNNILVSGEDLLGSNLNGARTDDSVVNNSLSHSWSGVKSLVDLSQRGSNVSVAKTGWGKDAFLHQVAQ